ncbi:hypothetical protein [Oerskovia turbata]
MEDERGWAWVVQVARPALEVFGIATLLLALAGVLPGVIVAAAVVEYEDEAPRAAAVAPEYLAAEREFAFLVGGFGVLLAAVIAVVGFLLARRAGVRSRIACPGTVALCAVISTAAIGAALLLAMNESPLAAGCAVGATLLLLAALGAVALLQVPAALRGISR